MSEQRVFPADTDCEVLIDGEWAFAVIAEWRLSDGEWSAWARASTPDGNRILIVPANEVRGPQLDWARGRQLNEGARDIGAGPNLSIQSQPRMGHDLRRV